MNFKKLLIMFSITLFAGSGTIGIINNHVFNTKLIKDSLLNKSMMYF